MVFIAFQLCGTDERIERNILITVGSAIYFSEKILIKNYATGEDRL